MMSDITQALECLGSGFLVPASAWSFGPGTWEQLRLTPGDPVLRILPVLTGGEYGLNMGIVIWCV